MHSTFQFFLCSLIAFLFFQNGLLLAHSDDLVGKIANFFKDGVSSFKSENFLDGEAPTDYALETGENIVDNVFDCTKFENPFKDFASFAKPIDDNSILGNSSIAKASTSWFVKSIKTTVKTTSEHCKSVKPLTFFTALDETCLVNRTGKSLKISILNPITVATMTGSILGGDLFQEDHYSFAWRKRSRNATHNLLAVVSYFNLKYGSMAQSMDFSDGITIVIFPIAVKGDLPNPKFNQFSHFLQKNIKAPGDHAKTPSAPTYLWFLNFSQDSVYSFYKTLYFHENTGKTTNATVIELQSHPENYISNEQYQESLGRMKDIWGINFRGINSSAVQSQKGINIFNLPA